MKAANLTVLLWALLITPAFGQPRLIAPEPGSYLPGDSIDPEVTIYDSDGRRIRLAEFFDAGFDAVVLVLLGGAADELPRESRRGQLWCEDSFDDLAVQRALVSFFADWPVRFIAVAIPDVLTPENGGRENVLLGGGDNDREFSEKLSRFIGNTEKERLSTVLPFEDVFYDPRGRLVFSLDSLGEVSPGYGEVHDWQGKFKWHLDPRTYGLPTIWVLTGDGKVACEPFWGNDYDSSPPQVNYGFRELKEAVENLLE